jgi:hypothetical protein
MKKMKKIIPIVLLIATTLFSCKKEKCPVVVPPVDISGTAWSGPITNSGVTYTISFTLKNDGSLGNGVFAPAGQTFTGSWYKNPNTNDVRIFLTTAIGGTLSGAGFLNATATKIENIAFLAAATGATGTFTVSKQ